MNFNQCSEEKILIKMPNDSESLSEPLTTVSNVENENDKISHSENDKTSHSENDKTSHSENDKTSLSENDKTSLSIIAIEYDSNSDEEEMEVNTNKTENQNVIPDKQTLQQYRTIEEDVSSCEETDSEDDSSSSCSSTNSDSTNSDIDSDDITSTNDNKKKKGNKANTIKKKKEIENEFDIIYDLPSIEDLKISVPEVLCDPLGEVNKIVEQMVIVKPKPGKPTLHVDTILFVEKGEKALGKILDVFGPVGEPNYLIRFNNSEHIQENNIKIGILVFYCPNTQYTSLIFLHELHKMKSYDAVGDDEPPAFSDDEEERAYYETLKQKNNKESSDSNTLRKRHRISNFTQNRPTVAEWQLNHPWNRNATFQRNQERQQELRNNDHFNLSQYGPHSYNHSWPQYQYQSNMHWPPISRNMHAMFNRPNNEPSFNEGLPQYGNYNSNSSGDAKQYFQGTTLHSQRNNVQSQYPRTSFGAPPRFNLTCSSFPSNYPPNAPFSYVSNPMSARTPTHTNTLWPSLPPPPPPPPPSSSDSVTID